MLTFVYLNSDGQVNLDSFELDVGTFWVQHRLCFKAESRQLNKQKTRWQNFRPDGRIDKKPNGQI